MCGRFAQALGSGQLVPHMRRHYPRLEIEGFADDEAEEGIAERVHPR